MTLDDPTPGAAHKREVEQARGVTRSNPYVDPVDQQDRYLELLAEDIAAIEDELAYKRAEYERVRSWEPEPVRRDTPDPRVFDLGVDSAPRPPSQRREAS